MARRIFIALMVPKSVQDEVAQLQQKLQKFDWPVRWEPLEKIHLTLRFLGQLDDHTVQQVLTIVQDIARSSKQFKLTFQGFIVLPSFEVPRVITVGVGDSDELNALYGKISSVIESAGIGEHERLFFTPHLTIGRMKPVRVNFRALTKIKFIKSFSVGSIDIMQSIPTPQGSKYSVIKSYNLY